MKTSDLIGIIKLLSIPNIQYISGVTQRYFEWNKTDIENYLEGMKYINLKKERPYLINSMVTKKIKNSPHFDIVSLTDGQQRTTTTYLHICAICAFLKNNDLCIGDMDYNAIRDLYLVNPHASEGNRYKLLLRKKDRDTLKMIVEELPLGGMSTNLGRNKIINAYNQLYASLNEDNIEETFEKLFYMFVVNITAEENDDEYVIFNMINNGGRKVGIFTLCKAHAIGNFDIKTQELYDKLYWENIENNESVKGTIIRSYISYHSGHNQNSDYEQFKEVFAGFDSIDSFHKSFQEYSNTFFQIMNNDFKDKNIKEVMEGVKLIFQKSRYMIFVKLLELYTHSKLSKEDLLRCLNLILNVALRNYLIDKKRWDIHTRPLFEYGLKWLDESDPYNSLVEKLSKFFIADNKFNMILCSENFYKNKDDDIEVKFPSNINKITHYLLLRIENNHLGAGRINGNHFDIEHVCSQNYNEHWSPFFTKEEHKDYVHNLGNLSLLAKEHNSSVGDSDFSNKKKVYEFDKLWLGRGLCSYDEWTPENLLNRTHVLADELCEIFKLPSITLSLKNYKPNHPTLMEGK